MILVLNAAEGLLQILILDKTPTQDLEAACPKSNYPQSLAPNLAVYPKLAPILAKTEIKAVSQGTELLAPALQQLFTTHNLAWADLQGIACVTGPGSFTGLRLILSTASALVRINPDKSIKLAPLNYLQLLAASLPASYQGKVRVMTHAKQGLVHTADYLVPSLQEILPPQMLNLDAAYLAASCLEAGHKASATATPDFWLGSGVQRNLELFQDIPKEKLLSYPPTLEALALLASAKLAWQTTDLEPMYLRVCDAEMNLGK